MNPRILIIEDDTVLLRLYSQVLRSQRYEVASAETLDEARQHLSATTFDLLLADVQMGHEKSTDLLVEMRLLIRPAPAGLGQARSWRRSHRRPKPIDARPTSASPSSSR